MINKKSEVGPIFIVGMNGSGTTMMADCLNNHPDIFIPRYESKIIPYYYLNLEQYGDLTVHHNFNKLLDEFSNTHIFKNLNGSLERVKIPYEYDKIENRSLSGIIDLTFAYFANSQGKRIWGDHSPKYAICLNTLVDLFPNCKIIHMVRDARDCALSFKRRFKQDVSRTAFEWKKIVKIARGDGLRLGTNRYYEIRYEELTSDPDHQMQLLFDFLELPFDRIVLKSRMPMFRKSEIKKVDTNTIVRNFGKWKSGLSTIQIKQIESIAGKTLKDFNYEVKFFTGDLDIPPFRLLCIQILGKIKAAYIIYKEDKGRNRLERLSRVALSSIKQMKYFK